MNPWIAAIFPRFGKMPKAGERWRFRAMRPRDPWPRENSFATVTILDVARGWVRYDFNGSSMFKDQRMVLSSFKFCYEFDGACVKNG